jgi:hypothetical protein
VVEQHHALGHPERVVVGDRGDAGAQLDVTGALGGRGDEDLRRAMISVPAEWCSPIQASS